MAGTVPREVLADEIAMSVARALAAANRRARDVGVDVPHSYISVTQRTIADVLVWRVSYGPLDPVGRRGGDVIVDVGCADAHVRQVLRGQ